MKLQNRSILLSFAALTFALVTGCETAPKGQVAKENLKDQSQTTVRELQRLDPSLQSFLQNNYAYAIFPSIGKGGALVGGAYGHGTVYRGKEFLGWAEISQGSVGLQLGGETFTEIVVFKDEGTFQEFRHKGEWSTGATASAVALKAGAARDASFYDGVAYLIRPNGGLMFDLSIQGQKFNFKSADGSVDTGAPASKREVNEGRTTEQTTTVDSDGNRTTVEKSTTTTDKAADHQSKIGQRNPNGNSAE